MGNGRRVVLTAAAPGIDRAIARAFAADSDRVLSCEIDQDALTRVTDGNPPVEGDSKAAQ